MTKKKIAIVIFKDYGISIIGKRWDCTEKDIEITIKMLKESPDYECHHWAEIEIPEL